MGIKSVLYALAMLGAALPAACTQYLDRKDTAGFSAGNAVRTNAVTHVIDPWPAHAWNNRIAFDGERMQRAVERYRTNRVTDPSCAVPNERGYYPEQSGGTVCAERPVQPTLPRRGGTAGEKAQGPSGGGAQ